MSDISEAAMQIDRDALDEWMRARDLMLIRNSYFAELTRDLATARAEVKRLRAVIKTVRQAWDNGGLIATTSEGHGALNALDAAPTTNALSREYDLCPPGTLAEVERLRAELAVAERSMPKVTVVEPSPEEQAKIEAWYAALDRAAPPAGGKEA